MDCEEAGLLFESCAKLGAAQVERCYVFIVSTADEKFVLRCSKERNAYKDTGYWLNALAACKIPVPAVLFQGRYKEYSYLILSYIPGGDLGDVYHQLSGPEKKRIAKEVAAIQRKVSRLAVPVEAEWTWSRVVEDMLDRAEERIRKMQYFDAGKVHLLRGLKGGIQDYLDQVRPTPYLDDISTKNLLIHEGRYPE